MFLKRSVALFVLGLLVCAGIFAQGYDYLRGDEINDQLQKYVRNVSKLIPDSVTTQNMWSYAPRSTGGIFGGGLNASFTFAEQSAIGGANYEEGGFTKNGEISSFPDAILFLPAMAFDVRIGSKYFDFGLMGMWADSDGIEQFAAIVGEGSHYVHRTIGIDFRVALLTDNVPRFFNIPLKKVPRLLIPSVSAQSGYYFTWMSLGFNAVNNGAIDMDFRNDAFFFSLQASKRIFDLVAPFIGMKMIFAKTFSEYSWNTGSNPADFRGKYYDDGMSYKSGTKEGEFYTYLHFYGGLGFTVSMLDVTIGASYNVISEHFSVSAGARVLFR